MSYRIIVSNVADQDIEDIFFYILDDSINAAIRFRDALDEVFERLSDLPHIGSLRTFNNPLLEQVRVLPVSGFRNHLVFYQVGEDTVEILRVLHAARDIEGLFEL